MTLLRYTAFGLFGLAALAAIGALATEEPIILSGALAAGILGVAFLGGGRRRSGCWARSATRWSHPRPQGSRRKRFWTMWLAMPPLPSASREMGGSER
jgi:hypothetical protein